MIKMTTSNSTKVKAASGRWRRGVRGRKPLARRAGFQMVCMPAFFAPAMSAFDVSLEESSRVCGAANLQTLMRVTLPVLRPAILAAIGREGITDLTLHDRSRVRARAVPQGYDPTDRDAVGAYLREAHARGEVVTGILYVDPSRPTFHELLGVVQRPLVAVPYSELSPGSAELERFAQS